MTLPGLQIQTQNGRLSLQQGSSAQTPLIIGPSLGGTPNTLQFFGSVTAMQSALLGGKGLELAAYVLDTAGAPVAFMPVTQSVRGGVGTPTKTGTGASTLTLSIAPNISITITCTTGGALGAAAFTFTLGSGTASAPVTSASSWSSTGYLVPGTNTTVLFTAGTYVGTGTEDIYTISTLGVVAHPQGAGPAVPTFTSSPVDDYAPSVTVQVAGALGTMQFAYSLDGTTANQSASVLSPSGGAYAIPGTGLVLTFSGTSDAGDSWTFKAAAATFSNTDLTNAFAALETTYAAQGQYALIAVCDGAGSASAWVTMSSTVETAGLALFAQGIYERCFIGCPTVGTVIPDGSGGVTVDSADTDTVVTTARQTMAAPHAVPCAGDCALTSPLTGLSLRRNAVWPAIARAAAVSASQSIAAVADGGLTGITALYRDENATPAFDAAGITSLRTFGANGAAGYYVTDAYTGDVSTSDYYKLVYARVIDRGCGVARRAAFPYVQSKVPTTTRNNVAGVITEAKAKQIDGVVGSAMKAALVLGSPQDAVAANAVTDRDNDVLDTGQLIIAVNIQPYGYARMVTVLIGLTASA